MKVNSFVLIPVLVAAFAMCGSTPGVKKDLLQYSKEASPDYEKYLVNKESYTSNGGYYQEKYHDYLLGAAKMIKDQNVNLTEHSVGFYYDRRLDTKKQHYVGFDIVAEDGLYVPEADFTENARNMIKKYYNPMCEVLFSCKNILDEKGVSGAVIGISWKNNGIKYMINLWVEKSDLAQFEAEKLTFRELVYRTTVTGLDGKVMRITL